MSEPSPREVGDTTSGESHTDGLLARLDVIEQQPLADRAQSYTALHDELSRRLESADVDG